MTTAASYDAARPTSTRSDTTIEFSGKTSEYFKIWIVNLLLSIITLGIYSAWAKVRTTRYFYGNTHIEGSSFDYTANPLQILKGRFIALLAIVIYQGSGYFSAKMGVIALVVLLILLPATIALSMRFRMRNTVWRGLRFNFSASMLATYKVFLLPLLIILAMAAGHFWFDVDFEAIAQAQSQGDEPSLAQSRAMSSYFQLIGALTLVSFLIFPWWQKMYFSFIAKNTRFGTQAFKLTSAAREFYIIYVVAGLLVILASIIVGVAFGIAGGAQSPQLAALLLPLLILPYVVSSAVVFTLRTNAIYSNLSLADATFNCELKIGTIIQLYFTNTLAILFSLGFAIPWAIIRMAKYRASVMSIRISNLDDFVGQQTKDVQSLGEEVGEIFDLDLGF